MTVFDILIIDDDQGNFFSLNNFAAKKGIVLRYAKSLEEGMKELEDNTRIMGIILDGKGLIHKDDYAGTATSGFVHEALTRIAVLEATRKKEFPKCVLTAWYDNLKESLQGRGVMVFDKKKIALNEQFKHDLFDYLIERCKNTFEYSLREKFRIELTWMDEPYLLTKYEGKLFQVLYSMEYDTGKGLNFNLIREIYEQILKNINYFDKTLLPDFLFSNNGRPNLGWTLRYLEGKDITTNNGEIITEKNCFGFRVPDFIHDCAFFVKEITSVFSHANDNRHAPYAYKAAVFSLLEFIKWYVNWVIEIHSKDKTHSFN